MAAELVSRPASSLFVSLRHLSLPSRRHLSTTFFSPPPPPQYHFFLRLSSTLTDANQEPLLANYSYVDSQLSTDTSLIETKDEKEQQQQKLSKETPVRFLGEKLSLNAKEKKELASYAHSLGKKLKSQQVGKSGVTESVAAAFIENLECNELLKLKIHNNCPGELDEVIKKLEETTGSVAVGQIGRTVILYRPSLSKMKEVEEKKQAQAIRKRVVKPKFTLKKEPTLKLASRGRRGSSRV